MQLSSALCRTQEALHRDRAAGAQLENVRLVAASAAAAWALEALNAERREERVLRVRAESNTDSRRTLDDRERSFSENPNRGFESDLSR